MIYLLRKANVAMSKFASSVQSPTILLGGAVLWLLAAAPCFAQFKIDDRALDIHGFVTQGFAYSNQNNYLTMPTSRGTFALTDAGLNMSLQVTDKLRIGGQAYTR